MASKANRVQKPPAAVRKRNRSASANNSETLSTAKKTKRTSGVIKTKPASKVKKLKLAPKAKKPQPTPVEDEDKDEDESGDELCAKCNRLFDLKTNKRGKCHYHPGLPSHVSENGKTKKWRDWTWITIARDRDNWRWGCCGAELDDFSLEFACRKGIHKAVDEDGMDADLSAFAMYQNKSAGIF